jgi:hypothetical protein
MSKIFSLIFSILFIYGCATTSACSDRAARLADAIHYQQNLRGTPQNAIVDAFGLPDAKEAYCPSCDSVEVWHYQTPYCQEGLHLLFVNRIATDIDYW